MKIGICCCIGAAVAALGCSRSSSAPAQTTLTSAPAPAPAPSEHIGPVVSTDEAVMSLTNSRCDREVACNNVGSDRLFADRDACTRELGRDAYVNLDARDCPGGVDDAKLATCLADVRNERCNNPLDSIERLLSCRRRELCVE